MLCHRCEYRAKYNEKETMKKGSGHGPRYECQTDMAVNSCYMYKPTKPLVVEPSDSEKRLREQSGINRGLGGLMGGRVSSALDQPEFEVVATQLGEDLFLIENRIKKQ